MLQLFTVYALFTSVVASIKDCDTSSQFRPTQLTLIPDPPVPEQPVYLTLLFDNTGPEVTDGTVTTSINVNYVPITPTMEPLCENTACPIVSGNNNRSTETIFPSFTGAFRSRVTWTGKEGRSLLCIDTNFKVANGHHPFYFINFPFRLRNIISDAKDNAFKRRVRTNLRAIVDDDDNTMTTN